MNPTLFAEILAALTNPDTLSEYVSTRQLALPTLFLANILPPVESTTDEITASNVRIVPGVAAVTGLDSPYAKVGDIQLKDAKDGTFKLTAEARFSEQLQRAMHARAQSAYVRSRGSDAAVSPIYTDFIGKFLEDGISMSFDYAQEQYRALALAHGKIKGKFGKIALDVDFGVPAEHKLDRSTDAKGGYAGANSKLWEDADTVRRLLRVEPEAIVNPNTAAAILNNAANAVFVESRTQVSSTVEKYVLLKKGETLGGGTVAVDARYRLTLWVYSGSVGTPGAAYFWPDAAMTYMRRTARVTELVNGQIVRGNIGVTHVGPNTELAMLPGRFLSVYRPEGRQFEAVAQGTEFVLPHIQEERNLVLVDTGITG